MIEPNELRRGNWVKYNNVTLQWDENMGRAVAKSGNYKNLFPIPVTAAMIKEASEDYRGFDFSDCRYLHTLQNTYYSLTGEEFTVAFSITI